MVVLMWAILLSCHIFTAVPESLWYHQPRFHSLLLCEALGGTELHNL